jgi:hypothetical protein
MAQCIVVDSGDDREFSNGSMHSRISVFQYSILETIGKFWHLGGITQSLLCKQLDIDSNYAHHHLRVLEKFHLVWVLRICQFLILMYRTRRSAWIRSGDAGSTKGVHTNKCSLNRALISVPVHDREICETIGREVLGGDLTHSLF